MNERGITVGDALERVRELFRWMQTGGNPNVTTPLGLLAETPAMARTMAREARERPLETASASGIPVLSDIADARLAGRSIGRAWQDPSRENLIGAGIDAGAAMLPFVGIGAIRGYNTASGQAGRLDDFQADAIPADRAGALSAGAAQRDQVVGMERSPAPLLDPEGRDISAARVVVGRAPDGTEVPLAPADALRAAGELTSLSFVPPSRIRGDAGRVVRNAEGGLDMLIANDHAPRREAGTLRHELGHVGELSGMAAERAVAELPETQRAALMRELRRASQAERPEFWTRGANPKPVPAGKGYVDTLAELYADAQARYAADPAGFKAAYPEAARLVRKVWNSNPRLARQIGFNVLPLAVGAGAAASQAPWLFPDPDSEPVPPGISLGR